MNKQFEGPFLVDTTAIDTFEQAIEQQIGTGIVIKGSDDFFVKRDACLQLFAWLVKRAETCKDGIHDLIIENVLDYGEKYTKQVIVPLLLGQEPQYSMTDITCDYIRNLLEDNHSDLILSYWDECIKTRMEESNPSVQEQFNEIFGGRAA